MSPPNAQQRRETFSQPLCFLEWLQALKRGDRFLKLPAESSEKRRSRQKLTAAYNNGIPNTVTLSESPKPCNETFTVVFMLSSMQHHWPGVDNQWLPRKLLSFVIRVKPLPGISAFRDFLSPNKKSC